MEGAGESLTKSVSVPMAAAGTAAIKFASESQDAYKQFAAATGTATENLGKYQDMINNVYKDNFGESIGDVADAMAKVDQNMSYLDDSALQRCTEYAYTLADTFDVDIGESTRAADSLIKNFGVSAREAFNLMTQGAQNGLDFSGELFDNIDEYSVQVPKYIVIHNTDNYAAGADARAHAKAQHDGNFSGYSAHVFVDDKEAYQALPYNRGAWHVGVNYGGRLFGVCSNHNSIGIEMCVQSGYNYEKAFQNTVNVCKQLMKQYGIDAAHVLQHYDVCAKNCPSTIRAKGDWNRFKRLIGSSETVTVEKYYRTRKTWTDSKSQIGAYKSLENAKKEWKQGYTIYDWNGKAVYPVQTSKKAVVLTGKFETQLPIIREGNSGVAVSVLQSVLGVTVDGHFGDDTKASLKVFQKNTGVKVSGTCGIDTWKKVIEHVKANTK